MIKRRVVSSLAVILVSLSSISPLRQPTAEVVEQPEQIVEAINRERDRTAIDSVNMARAAERICPERACEACYTAVMRVIYNRSRLYGVSIEEVCNQTDQWQYLNTSSTASSCNLNRLARENLERWQSTGDYYYLPCNRNVLYIVATENGFSMRSEWNGAEECYVPYY